MPTDDPPASYWTLTPTLYREFQKELQDLRQRVATLEVENQWLSERQNRPVRALEEVLSKFGVDRGLVYDEAGVRQPHPRARFIAAVRSAVKRGKSWDITPDDYEYLASQPCDECGGPTGKSVGLDRLDHDLGYSVDNVRPCCGPCNLRRGRRPIGATPG